MLPVSAAFVSSTGTVHACGHLPSSGRNLAAFIDGTAFDGNMGSNVVQLFQMCEDIMALYVSGIGAKDDRRAHDPLPGRILDQVTGVYALPPNFSVSILIVCTSGFKANIFDVYQWLSENYEPNDKIFLFGE